MQQIGKEVKLQVYNFVSMSTREVTLIPNEGKTTKDLLGVLLKFEKYDDVHEKVYQVDLV